MGDYEKIKEKVKDLLSEQIGVDREDIHEDDSLTEDLHMNTNDIVDFIEVLSKNGFEVNGIDFSQITSFSELIDQLAEEHIS